MMEFRRQLPNATTALILGILSIVITLCCFFMWGNFIGIVLGVSALIISQRDVRMYRESPEVFTDYGNLKTGRITAVIGIILSVIITLYFIISLFYVGIGRSEIMDELLKEYEGINI